jgi:AraC family transcriptional regulator
MLVVQLDPSRLSWREASAPRDPLGLTRRGALHAAWRVHRALDPDLPTIALEEAVADLLSHVPPVVEVRETKRPKWLDRVIERLHCEYAEPPSLAALAAEAGVHASHLSRTLRRHEGRGIAELVQHARVEHVWRHLVADDAPSLVEVALAAGFADQSHCNRVFKGHVGESPGAFLRRKGDIPLFRERL